MSKVKSVTKRANEKARQKRLELKAQGKKMGRPPKAPITSLSDPRLEAEVNLWYRKLKRSGFKDIENGKYTRSGDYTTQAGLYSMDAVFDQGSGAAELELKYERLHLVSCYVANMPEPKNSYERRKKLMLSLYAEGKSAQTISKALKSKRNAHLPGGKSVYTAHYEIKAWLKEVVKWNYEHPDGLYRSQLDKEEDLLTIVGLREVVHDQREIEDEGEQ